MLSVSEAEKEILSRIRPGPAIRVPLREAAGRVLREALLAERDAPPFDRVMMDGFAVKVGLSTYQIHGRSHAGEAPASLNEPESAIEVMTGCVLPKGADAVIPIEDVQVDGDTLLLSTAAQPGQFIHRRGNEGLVGRVVLRPGARMGPAQMAIAATEGATLLTVNARIRMSLITTGDEVVALDAKPQAWQIRGSHAVALQSMFCKNGDLDISHRHLADEENVLREAFESAMVSADVLLICGGMSKGKRDLVPHILAELGAQQHFHFVAQRPGKPMGFWTRGHTAIFGLPGNPLAVLCAARRHVVPALDLFRGSPPAAVPRVRLCGNIESQNRFTTFHPVRLGADGAEPLPAANSGALHALAESDGFVEIPPADDKGNVGDLFGFWAWI